MCYKALADLGASVSVMPYSTYTTLGLGDLIPTKLIVELADRIVKRPKGIVENVLVELRHDQVIDLGPTIKEGKVINATIKEMVQTRHDDDKITNGIEDYPSFNNLIWKIPVNDAYNLRFYNSIMKDKLEFRGKRVVGAFMIGTFSDLVKEISMNIGGESRIWKSGSVGVLKLQDGCSTHNLA
ncbi:homeodomain-like protein [Tanacetum coccineum]